jgi:hypothetical protein
MNAITKYVPELAIYYFSFLPYILVLKIIFGA